MPALKLQEVIWEITPRCNKNCTFCGSANIKKNKPLKDNQILKIAEQIANYGVSEVNLSGGEPGTLDTDLLNSVIDILHAKNVKVKFVSNGTIFNKDSLHWDKVEVVGVSINTDEDMKQNFEEHNDLSKHTMITNFGVHNIFGFDRLAEYAKKFACWQIQLTTGSRLQLEKDGIIFLKNKINSAQIGKTKIVEADNLQYTHICTAGIRSCGILFNGGVVACLSERSYCDLMDVQGNVLTSSLKDVWETKFRDIRFGNSTRKSCRDCFKYPDPPQPSIKFEINPDENGLYKFPPNESITVLYGVQSLPSGISVYAVYSPSIIPNDQSQAMAYAVIKAVYAVWSGSSGNDITITPNTGTTTIVYGTFNANQQNLFEPKLELPQKDIKEFKKMLKKIKKPKK